jgi:hypothetical protein
MGAGEKAIDPVSDQSYRVLITMIANAMAASAASAAPQHALVIPVHPPRWGTVVVLLLCGFLARH